MATQKEILNSLVQELETIKQSLPNGELIQKSLDDLEKGQEGIKDNMRTIQKRLFNPDNGLIVETNKNTEFRKTQEKVSDDLKDVINWKSGVQKGLWMLYSAVVGLILKIIFWE